MVEIRVLSHTSAIGFDVCVCVRSCCIRLLLCLCLFFSHALLLSITFSLSQRVRRVNGSAGERGSRGSPVRRHSSFVLLGESHKEIQV